MTGCCEGMKFTGVIVGSPVRSRERRGKSVEARDGPTVLLPTISGGAVHCLFRERSAVVFLLRIRRERCVCWRVKQRGHNVRDLIVFVCCCRLPSVRGSVLRTLCVFREMSNAVIIVYSECSRQCPLLFVECSQCCRIVQLSVWSSKRRVWLKVRAEVRRGREGRKCATPMF